MLNMVLDPEEGRRPRGGRREEEEEAKENTREPPLSARLLQ